MQTLTTLISNFRDKSDSAICQRVCLDRIAERSAGSTLRCRAKHTLRVKALEKPHGSHLVGQFGAHFFIGHFSASVFIRTYVLTYVRA